MHSPLEQLVDLLYQELHRIAHHKLRDGRPTLLDTTALVHECFERMRHAGSLLATDRATLCWLSLIDGAAAFALAIQIYQLAARTTWSCSREGEPVDQAEAALRHFAAAEQETAPEPPRSPPR